MGVTANLIVPLSAIAVYLAASIGSIRYRNVWLWPVAALLGSITFEVGWTIIDEGVHWICYGFARVDAQVPGEATLLPSQWIEARSDDARLYSAEVVDEHTKPAELLRT